MTATASELTAWHRRDGAQPLRIGTRGSTLAQTQTQIVVDALRAAHPDLETEVVVVKTTGDRSTASLREIGGQGAFTRELEFALLERDVDVAVHSLKDLPSTVPDGLVLTAFPERGNPRDALIAANGAGLLALPQNARVGTGSLRRRAQLLAARSDLEIADIRGNVDTRMRKLEEGRYDAIVLAAAGLERMGWLDRATEVLPIDVMIPAPSQAVLGLECRADDERTRELLQAINDPHTEAAARAERAVLRRLGAGCRLPVAAFARPQSDGSLRLVARVLGFDGDPVLEETTIGRSDEPEDVGYEAAERLIGRGARKLLEQI